MDERTGATVEKGSFVLSSIINYKILHLLRYDKASWNMFVISSSYLTFTLTLELLYMTDQYRFNSRESLPQTP